MRLTALDWLIVIVSIAVSFLPAILLARRAGRSTAEFFASGRAAPWWLIGVSMVATTFSAVGLLTVGDAVTTELFHIMLNWLVT